MIDKVAFDMDGVLIDSERISLAQWKKAGEMCGVQLDMSLFKHLCGSQMSQMPPDIRAQFPPQDVLQRIMDIKAEMRAVNTTPFALKPGVNQLLDFLAAHGIKAYLVSSTAEPAARQRLAPYGLDHRMQGYMFGSMVKLRKPDPEIYLLAAAKFGLEGKHTIVVEDSESGVIAAHAAGLRVVGVPDCYDIAELQQQGLCIIKKDLIAVMHYIAAENGVQADATAPCMAG